MRHRVLSLQCSEDAGNSRDGGHDFLQRRICSELIREGDRQGHHQPRRLIGGRLRGKE